MIVKVELILSVEHLDEGLILDPEGLKEGIRNNLTGVIVDTNEVRQRIRDVGVYGSGLPSHVIGNEKS